MRSLRQLACVALLVGAVVPAAAKPVRVPLPSGLAVNAEYQPGDTALPVLLVLHGFLQTNEFQATRHLVDGLAGLGYPVLAPTLSLGVDNRRRSLPCEALHKHTLDEDVAEIDFWVNWLLKHGYRHLVLVGQSWGGQHAIAYLQAHPDRPVTALVAVSLVRARQSESTVEVQSGAATSLLKQERPQLMSYQLNFCGKYTATPQSYLSYAAWTDSKVIASLKKVRVPVYVILGGADKRSDPRWKKALAGAGANISVVDGADHFFSSMYEFDLIDAMQSVLRTLGPAH